MVERIISTEKERDLFIRFMRAQKIPFTASILKGKHRSTEQNRLQRMWVGEIAEQLGDRTPEEVRGWCKLHLGVPILRNDSEEFREKYDKIIRPLPYEHKIECMMVPLDFSVTRLMTTAQKTKYLDAIVQHFSAQGVVLTDPQDRGRTTA